MKNKKKQICTSIFSKVGKTERLVSLVYAMDELMNEVNFYFQIHKIFCDGNGNTTNKKERRFFMGPDTFVGLTEDKLRRIAELPYILLAQQISKQEDRDISVTVTVKLKNEAS